MLQQIETIKSQVWDALANESIATDTDYERPDSVLEVLAKCTARAALVKSGDVSKPTTVSGLIDHTLLKPEATPEQITRLCDEALHFDFVSVCVNPVYVLHAKNALVRSEVSVCAVIGFPLGANSTISKIQEAQNAAIDGAEELDMVIPIGLLKAGDYAAVYRDITGVVEAAHGASAVCKVIIETALLTDDEKIAACLIAALAGADFVKTSTGFSTAGATLDDVRLMRAVVGESLGVKASGGVRSYADLKAMVEAGATRIGASAGVKIMNEVAQ